MATPGRTHISWHDQTGQIHELISYIGFLEAKLQYLQQHHEHCDSWMNEPFRMDIDLPYLPPDIVVANELPPTPVSIQEEVPLPIYKPVPAPSAPISQKVPDGNPRWKRIVDAMVKDWDQSQSWTQKRSALGLDSVERNKYALMAILGYQKETPILNFQSSSPPTSHQSVPNTNTTDALIMSARQYAIDTKALGKNAGLLVQVHVFRELVFASLCVVMEQQNLPIDTINDLMRICMSSSGPANLYRLRRGALWVNRVIRGMIKKGWGHGATEFWLLCGFPSHLSSLSTFTPK
jgi:hypothetical protein